MEKLVPAAFDAGIRCIIAPWIPDRRGNDDLVTALNLAGGHSAFWGYEDYISLSTDSWESHLAALPVKKRNRIKADDRKAAAVGFSITRVDGAAIRPYAERIAELTCLNREKNGGGEEPAHILGLLTGLLDEDADVRTYLGFKDDTLVASCVTIHKNHRLFIKWVGFDYAAIGERSGIYFALVMNAPVRDACSEGLRTVEFGAGAHEAKACAAALLGRSLLPWFWPTRACVLRPRAGSTPSAVAGRSPSATPPNPLLHELSPC